MTYFLLSMIFLIFLFSPALVVLLVIGLGIGKAFSWLFRNSGEV